MHPNIAAKNSTIARKHKPVHPEKYRFWRALRPFSFPVALLVCLIGILAAYMDGYFQAWPASLILLAALLLQAGVNLINDYADLSLIPAAHPTAQQIRFNFKLGLWAIILAAVLALYLIYHSGLVLLWLTLLGLLGALGYTLEPINYKRRGLAVVLVFWLMGVLMVQGSYYALSQQLSWQVLLLSLPISLATSLLLLSNELRDIEEDRSNGIHTLSVRIGEPAAKKLYRWLTAAIFLSCMGLAISGVAPYVWLALLSLPVFILPLNLLNLAASQRQSLPQKTGLSYSGFGILFCLGLYLSA